MSGLGTAVAVLLLAAGGVFADVDSNRLDGEDSPRAMHDDDDAWSPLGEGLRLWGECGGEGADAAGACLKVRLVAALDRAVRQLSGDVPLVAGVTLVAEGNGDLMTPALSERQLEATLPRAVVDREDTLDSMILDRLGSFFNSHSLQLKMAALGDLPLGFSGEGRKKGGGGKKGGLGLLLLPLMAFGSLVPLAFGALFLLAGKALLVSKIALLLSAILGLKKLFSQDNHGHESTVVVSGHEHHGRRLADDAGAAYDAHRLAYGGYLQAQDSLAPRRPSLLR